MISKIDSFVDNDNKCIDGTLTPSIIFLIYRYVEEEAN